MGTQHGNIIAACKALSACQPFNQFTDQKLFAS